MSQSVFLLAYRFSGKSAIGVQAIDLYSFSGKSRLGAAADERDSPAGAAAMADSAFARVPRRDLLDRKRGVMPG
jgi:hypothetical protein